MFAHKINELNICDNIAVGEVFDHKSKIAGETFTYEITYVQYSNKQDVNDQIFLKMVDTTEGGIRYTDSFEVEPEWFNQRVITFH